MSPLSNEQTARIMSSPSFKELVDSRSRLRWVLTLSVLLTFFGFIGLIMSVSSALGQKTVVDNIPLGITLGLGLIAMDVLLTGYYVQRSNTYFDLLTELIRREAGQ
jgi:uncharacterized membrane protein (DUF485 family)